jgi:N-acetylmuramoyl-L-alanine amidase-like protein
MDGCQETPAYSKHWTDRLAGQIHDPVGRLRFLQAVAPAPEMTSYRASRVVRMICPGALGSLLVVLACLEAGGTVHPVIPPAPRIHRSAGQLALTFASAQPAEVWQVEKIANSETYSNGLRIDDRMAVSNQPRAYLAYPLADPDATAVRRTDPAGIVFHTTESRLAPFEPDQNGTLKRLGESLLEYVQRKRAYHFLIDRFGRVYRVVAESDSANHAGNSVWADSRWLYINLNQSFIGVSVETRTEPGQVVPEMSPAQLRSATMLTEMLRSKYHLAAENCVTHAQVSVNPSNRQVGYHTDWASSFPFAQLGLPDNYVRPLPALWAFGFEYNPEFLHWAGGRIGAGVQLADSRIQENAAAAGLSVSRYRKTLQERYHRQLEAVRRANTANEEDSE